MAKQKLILLCVFVAHFATNGQTSLHCSDSTLGKWSGQRAHSGMVTLRRMIADNVLSTVNTIRRISLSKGTGVYERLIAASDYTNYGSQGVPGFYDSSTFYYGGSGFSSFDPNEGYKFIYNPFSRNDFYLNPYDPVVAIQGSVPSGNWDSSMTIDAVGQISRSRFTRALINGIPCIINNETFEQSVIAFNYRYDYAYTPQGQLSLGYEMTSDSNGNPLDTSDYAEFAYNGSNQLLSEKIFDKQPGNFFSLIEEYDFNYSPNGNLVKITDSYTNNTSIWYRKIADISYDIYGNRSSILYTADFGTGLQNFEKDSAKHNSAGVVTYSSRSFWDSASAAFVPHSIEKIHLNAQNLPDSEIIYESFGSPGIIEHEKVITKYDNFNNPVTIKRYDYAVPYYTIPNEIINYYYKQYNATNVQPLLKKPVELFPNPVSDKLMIESAVNVESVLVLDLPGNVVLRSNIHDRHAEINTSNFPGGIYFVHLRISDGTEISKKIVKY